MNGPPPSVYNRILRSFLAPFSSNWTESIHFVAIALGIIISGYWAFHTFDILSQKETAEAHLKKTNSELEKAKLELKELRDKINGTISSDISINVEKTPLAKDKSGLIITVTITNNGTQDIDMKWKNSPLRVYKLAHRGDQIASKSVMSPYLYRSLKTKSSTHSVYIHNLHLFVGAKKNLSFFVEAEPNNLYYIAFEADIDSATKNKLNKNGITGTWLSSKYYFIK